MLDSISKHPLMNLKLALGALDSANDGITVVDMSQADQPLIYVNHAFECLSGYTKDEIIGKNCRFLHKGLSCELERSIIRNAIKNKTSCKLTLKNVKKNGMPFWNELSLAPIFEEDGSVQYYVGIQKDMSTQALQEDKRIHLSQRDDLTQLYNYRGFFKYTHELLECAQRQFKYIGVGLVDINNFKQMNDILGHAYGNNILQMLSNEFLSRFKKEDVISRIGGDEFLFSFVLKDQSSDWFFLKIDEALNEVNDIFSGSFKVSLSVGFSVRDSQSLSQIDHLIRLADDQMIANKKQFYYIPEVTDFSHLSR